MESKNKMRKLRVDGYSYSEIAKKFDKSKKYTWRVCKSVKFSKSGNKRYSREVKGILLKIKKQKKGVTTSKIRIIGHLLFDGTVYKSGYHHFVRYINSSKELIDQFIKDVKATYGLNPSSIEVYPNCFKVTFKSKNLYMDLMNYFESYSTSNQDIEIPDMIINSKKNIKLEFLKSFFEDEGSISANGRLMGDSKSYKIIKQLGVLMEEFGFKFGICSYKEPTGYMYKIYLHKNKENLINFLKLGLFEKAIVAHGKNKGKKKLKVLKDIIKDK